MEQARRALREERNEDAQAILINVIAREPDQDEAWLLLAEALSEPNKKRECLERARAINPRNRAIARALERLELTIPPVAVEQKAAPPLPGNQVSVPGPPAPSPESRAAIQRLLEYGELVAQTILLTTEAPDTRNAGLELLKTLDEASVHDQVTTRRWTRSVGRSALFKLEKALTILIANLPFDDPQLPDLR